MKRKKKGENINGKEEKKKGKGSITQLEDVSA